MTAAVEFKGVSKRFILHHQRARSFQDLFVGVFKRNGSKEQFWALRDVSFEVRRGETLGIIGRNGSGKSTVLKLISRILQPTSGSIAVNGRVSALLELGAGFHPDLSGKENIYLNGSLLGLSKKEMDRKYDEIVEFSELEHFIDTPVKHYSSGMYMRLGFSIAVAVDPDILLADEVLAVGDEAFQRKCLDRMFELKRSNRAIILVSHDMEAVRQFCDQAVWLQEGRTVEQGSAAPLVDDYVAASRKPGPISSRSPRNGASEPEPPARQPGSRWGSQEAEIVSVRFFDEAGNPAVIVETGQTLIARIEYIAHKRIPLPVFGIAIHKEDGTHICGPNTKTSGITIPEIEGSGRIDFVVEDLPLLAGRYLLSTAIYDRAGLKAYDHHERMYPFMVATKITEERFGSVLLRSQWRVSESNSEIPRSRRLHD